MKNPFHPRLPPEFTHYKDDLGRGVAVWRGHERTVIHKEDLTPGDGLRAGDFGISDDDWVFAIRDPRHVAIGRVSSQALNGRLYRTPSEHRKKVSEIWGVKKGPQALNCALDFCSNYPTTEEQVRKSTTGSECSFQIDEKCFSGASTILGGEPIVHGLDTLFMSGPPDWWTADEVTVRENLLAFTDIWEKLEGWFLEQREESLKAAIGLPRQCECCHGAGVVPRTPKHNEASAGFNEW